MRVEDIDVDVLLDGMIRTRSFSGIVRVIEVTDVCKIPHFNDERYWILFKYESSIFGNHILSGWVSLDEYNKWNLPNQRDKILNELL